MSVVSFALAVIFIIRLFSTSAFRVLSKLSCEEFRSGVAQHESFKELARYALTCLVTPVSNAVIERIFSLATATKTKTRNRMHLPLLDAIVRIRVELLLSKQCCRDFQVTAEMLQNFKSDIVYQSEFSDEISLFD